MRWIEAVPLFILGALLGGFCLSFVVLHLRVLREMSARGKPLDREELLQVLLWAALTLIIAGMLGLSLLGL